MAERDPETPEQKSLRSISQTLMLVFIMVAAGLGQQCSSTDSGFRLTMRMRTSQMDSDLRAIKRQLDSIEKQLRARLSRGEQRE